MVSTLVVVAVVYLVVVVAVCTRVCYDLYGTRGALLGVLFGPLGVMICAMLSLSEQIGADLQRLDESIGHLDHAMASLMPWSRPRPKRPPA